MKSMTLRGQLFWGISVLFLVIVVGLMYLSVRGTRNYLEQQLGSHAQDAATALSIPLAQSLGTPDLVLAELQVASVFDRGFFQNITVLAARGEPILQKELPAKIEDVPLWFSSLFELRAPAGEAFISSGWRQLGKVVVTSQPAYAYQYLWTTATEIALWMALVYAVAMLLTHFLLRIILNPLGAIERSARAIQQRLFEQISKMPKARELASVVRAMNDMSRRIAEMLDLETAKAEGFRKQAFEDEVTGLDNRKAFDVRFGELLGGNEHVAAGLIMVLEVDGLKAFNTDTSYRMGNQLLAALADATRQTLVQRGTVLGRLGGASFGFVVPDVALGDSQALVHRLQQALAAVLEQADPGRAVSFSLGAVHFGGADQRGQIMAKVDLAVEAARQNGRNQVHLLSPEAAEQDALGSLGWRDLLRSALSEGRWRLLGQPVVSFADGSKVHEEVMVRLTDQQGALVPAAKFIPMAIRHHLMAEVDTAVITLVLRRLQGSAQARDMQHADQAQQSRLAVNVSIQSLQSTQFFAWLTRELQSLGERASGLAFELSRFGCAQDIELARRFAVLVRKHGAQFGMDRFGLDPNSMQTLRLLPPDYVKLDSVLLEEAGVGGVSTDLVGAIVSLARSLDVMVIAQGVETLAQAQALKATHDAGQGYHFGAPVELV